MFDVLDISMYVVSQYWQTGTPITNLKLQKILYYIQGYALKRNNEAAFRESIYKWPYGPVVPTAYFEYNQFRSQPIGEPNSASVTAFVKRLNKDIGLKSTLNVVIQKSYDFTATQLVEKTHAEDPWKNAEDSEIIVLKSIENFFALNDPLEIEVSEV